MGRFKTKKITNLSEVTLETEFPESDFSAVSPDGKFIQLEYIESDEIREPYPVKPGIWAIIKTPAGFKLEPTGFTEDALLESFLQTKDVVDKIDCFYNRIDVYKKRKIDVPIRRMLFYGPAGTGKSSIISLASRKYAKDGKTAIIIWHTDKFEAFEVKDFIKTFQYNGVERIMLIIEDIGGREMEKVSRPSDSSLLSLLDNQEKTFTIPTLIIATTNHPDTFLGNLTNRPGRFADKIKVGFPDSKARSELLKFFSHGEELSPDLINYIESNKCKELTVDHIKEIFIRADLYDKKHTDVVKELVDEIELYKKMFEDKNSVMGIGI